MAKGQQNQATSQAGSLASGSTATTNAALTGGGAFGPGLTPTLNQNLGNQQGAFNSANAGIQSAQQTGGYDPVQLKTIRDNSAGLAASGGYDPQTLGTLRQGFSQAATTGGYDPKVLDTLRTKGTEFTNTGGYDPWAAQGYKDFATTGGYSDQDKTNFLNRGTAGVSATYDALKGQAEAKRAATGGLGGGDEFTSMARHLAQDQADSTLNSNVALQQDINKNKFSGLAGDDKIAAGRQQALSTLGTNEGNVASGVRSALTGSVGLESDVASGRRAGVAQQAGIESGVAGGVTSANAQMAGLYNSATGAVSDTGKQILGMLGIDSNNQQAVIQAFTNLSKNPGIFDDILRSLSLGTSGYSAYQQGKQP